MELSFSSSFSRQQPPSARNAQKIVPLTTKIKIELVVSRISNYLSHYNVTLFAKCKKKNCLDYTLMKQPSKRVDMKAMKLLLLVLTEIDITRAEQHVKHRYFSLIDYDQNL